jgi:hypothetical protein
VRRSDALIAEALATRRAELGPAPLADPPGAEATDAEEALRVVMVRLVPAVADDESVSALAEGLEGIFTAARGDDLRFLDAWNNAYEAVAARPELMQSDAARRLVARYADLLDHHLQRL